MSVGGAIERARPLAWRSPAIVIAAPRLGGASLFVLALLVLVLLAGAGGTGYSYAPFVAVRPGAPGPAPAADPQGVAKALAAARKETRTLETTLARRHPRQSYIVVDRMNNRLYLKRGDRVLREATCSAGSGMVLRDVGGERTWVFDTPPGRHRVLSRAERPVWRKPDWAFVEEGKPVPKDPRERIEYGALGEYALYFGDGYMIHGTLYERLLGRPVTHGCIRLGRDDLRFVYRNAPIGTPIYIF